MSSSPTPKSKLIHKNDSLKPTKRQVNRRLKRLTGLKRKKVNRLRSIEKRQRKNRDLVSRGIFPGEEKLKKMNMDREAERLFRKVDKIRI